MLMGGQLPGEARGSEWYMRVVHRLPLVFLNGMSEWYIGQH